MDQFSRRGLLAAVLGAGALWTVGSLASRNAARAADAQSGSGAPAKVDEKDSMAVALGYVSDAKRVDAKANPAFKAGSSCSSCSWYQGKPGDAAGGPCTFFPGKRVDASGWCRMWNKKQ
ncbi:MAG TPA: high-potential iron-sulfur protein [Steroidobacteraceae bacterium]|nr:high-potential iron-sulfur protein [Steroidobacteraceae bacterium]